MISTIKFILLAIAFIIIPLFSLWIMLREYRKTQKDSTILSPMIIDLKYYRSLLSNLDLAYLDGNMSRWLEINIKKIEIPWIRNSLRLLVGINTLGFGENKRDYLQDPEYRTKMLQNFDRLIQSYENGDILRVYTYLAKLFSLIYDEPDNQSYQIYSQAEINKSVVNKLHEISEKIKENSPTIELIIRDAIKTADFHSHSYDNALGLLIFYWASIVVRTKEVNDRKVFDDSINSRNNLSEVFNNLSTLYNNNDYIGVINVISQFT